MEGLTDDEMEILLKNQDPVSTSLEKSNLPNMPVNDNLTDEQMEQAISAQGQKMPETPAPIRWAAENILAPVGEALTYPGELVRRGIESAYTGDADIMLGRKERTPSRELFGLSQEEKIPTPFRDIIGRTVKTSPAAIAGTGYDLVTDPLNWPGGPTAIAKGAGAVAKPLAKGAGQLWRGTNRVAANYLGNIPPEVYDYLIANRERLKGAKSGGEERLKEIAEETREATQPWVERSKKSSADLAKMEADYKEKIREFKKDLYDPMQSTADQQKIMAGMQELKDDLVQRSLEADEKLAASGKTYKRGNLIELLNNVVSEGKSVDAISDAAKGSIARLSELMEDLGGEVPGEKIGFGPKNLKRMANEDLDAPRVRDIMRQVRSLISWDKSPWGFDPVLNRMLKRFSGEISDTLKIDVPEYRVVMDQMSEMAKALEGMEYYIKGENEMARMNRATVMLENMRRGGAKAEPIYKTLSDLAMVTNNNELFEIVEQVKANMEARRLHKGITSEESLKKAFPKDYQKLEEARLSDVIYKGREKQLTKRTPEALVDTLKGRGKKLGADAVAQEIEKRTGYPLRQNVRDWEVLRLIEASKPMGAKYGVFGGGLGGGLATAASAFGGISDPTTLAGIGAIGTAVGTAAGTAMEKWGSRPFKWAIDRGTGLRKITKAIADNRIVSTPWAGLKKIDPSYVSAAHYALYNNDPEYRAWVDGLEE